MGSTSYIRHFVETYAYDAAGNLNYRTNNTLVENFQVNSVNELTNEQVSVLTIDTNSLFSFFRQQLGSRNGLGALLKPTPASPPSGG